MEKNQSFVAYIQDQFLYNPSVVCCSHNFLVGVAVMEKYGSLSFREIWANCQFRNSESDFGLFFEPISAEQFSRSMYLLGETSAFNWQEFVSLREEVEAIAEAERGVL